MADSQTSTCSARSPLPGKTGNSEHPAIEYRDSLAEGAAADAEAYSLILANPPFAGSLDIENTGRAGLERRHLAGINASASLAPAPAQHALQHRVYALLGNLTRTVVTTGLVPAANPA